MGIRPDDPRSPSDQIADDLRRAIAKGNIAPGGKVPSNSDLRATYEVATQTAQNAINALKAEGLVYSVPGRGVFVRNDLTSEDLLASMAKADGESPAYEQILELLQRIGGQISVINERLDHLEHRDQPRPDDSKSG